MSRAIRRRERGGKRSANWSRSLIQSKRPIRSPATQSFSILEEFYADAYAEGAELYAMLISRALPHIAKRSAESAPAQAGANQYPSD